MIFNHRLFIFFLFSFVFLDNMYVFEGKDYSKENASEKDKNTFEGFVKGIRTNATKIYFSPCWAVNQNQHHLISGYLLPPFAKYFLYFLAITDAIQSEIELRKDQKVLSDFFFMLRVFFMLCRYRNHLKLISQKQQRLTSTE